MPVYQLTKDLIFPPVDGAEEGIVSVGGDLRPERLMLAYELGIFPWYNEDQPIIWWSPDPRCVLFVDKIHVSKSMKRLLRNREFEVTFDQNFEEVIWQCKTMKRKGQRGTWITDEMQEAYIHLHRLGKAQSIEVWKNNELVGGMYGVKVGRVFSGESMFSKVPNASKVAIILFCAYFRNQGGHLLDCQVRTSHMETLGAEEISREEYLGYLG